jgi:hypothetical protein
MIGSGQVHIDDDAVEARIAGHCRGGGIHHGLDEPHAEPGLDELVSHRRALGGVVLNDQDRLVTGHILSPSRM